MDLTSWEYVADFSDFIFPTLTKYTVDSVLIKHILRFYDTWVSLKAYGIHANLISRVALGLGSRTGVKSHDVIDITSKAKHQLLSLTALQ